MNEAKIAKELLSVAKEMTAASEIDLSEVPEEKMALVKRMGLKPETAWEGLHGYIVIAKGSGITRLDKSDLKKLVSESEFRWISPSGKGFSIGL